MDTFQTPGSKGFDAQMIVHTATQNTGVSLALEFQNTIQMNHTNMVL